MAVYRVATQVKHKSSTTPTPHSIFVGMIFELIGVSVMAIIADSGKQVGNAMVALMGAFALMWFLLHYQFFAGLISLGASGD